MLPANFYKYQLFYIVLVSSALITGALIYTKPVLMPLTFALFNYFASIPIINFLEKKLKAPRLLSLTLTTGAITAISFFVILQISFSFKAFFQEIDVYQNSVLGFIGTLNEQALSFGINMEKFSLQEFVLSLPLKSYFMQLMGSTLGFLGNSFLVLIIYLFLMLGRSKSGHNGSSFLREVEKKVSNYVSYKIFLSALTGLLIGLILWSFGVKLAIVFGTLAFILNFIPSIGSVIATLLPLPIILLQFGFGTYFFVIIILCSLVQIVIGNFIDPKIIGKDLDLHPIVIILSLVFWSLIWGSAGIFLAVPLTGVIKIILAKINITKRFSEVLAGRL